jgi:hypothetical protein
MIDDVKDMLLIANVTLTIKNPLNKIFGSIPAGSSDVTQA